MISYTEIESPVGRLILGTNGTALTGIYFDGPHPPPDALQHWTRDAEVGPLIEAARQLEEYFMGARREFELPLECKGPSSRSVRGTVSSPSRTARRAATATRRSSSAIPTPRALWDSRTDAIRFRSSFPAIASSARTAPLRASVAASNASDGSSLTRDTFN